MTTPAQVADEVEGAGQQLIEAAYQLLDKGRALKDVSREIRYESVEPNTLIRVIADAEASVNQAAWSASDAVATRRRQPYDAGINRQ